jgi:eukaryotic-like serine/threonine-protein kinase
MNLQRNCPDCGSPLPPDAPEGICPECLMKRGLSFSQDTTLSFEPIETSDRRDLPNPGDQFGEYRIVRELGHGGMGAVYEAEQLETGRRVALKVLANRLNSIDARARFFREGRLAASINHPNSVYVYGTGEIEGTPAIVMELVDGGTLQERVQRDGPLPVGKAVDAIIDVISGLQAAQAKGILHRDIKPSNCFEDADGTVKVGDFGLSISSEGREEIDLTREGVFLGTPAFCSPEQLRGEELNTRSDLYSVGVTLFYLLTGRTPFEANTTMQLFANVLEKAPPSPRDFRSEIPDELAKVILRCLEKTPGERFRYYEDLHRALAPFGTDAPMPASLLQRFAAVLIDFALFSVISTTVLLLVAGDPFMLQPLGSHNSPLNMGTEYFWIMSLGFLIMVGYFALSEGRWGCSLGKAACRLRLVDDHRNSPGFRKAGMRAAMFLMISTIPSWIFYGLVAAGKASYDDGLFMIGAGLAVYIIIGLFFTTARRRNGWAGLHDLVFRTRVIRRPKVGTRPALSLPDIQPVAESESMPRIGAYHVLEKLEQGKDDQWLLGYDARLLRKIWIHAVPEGTPEVDLRLRSLRRIGRLRWISGRRSADENWDAYEAPAGAPLLDLAAKPQSWEFVRFWLLDLAEELAASAKDGTMPKTLSLDRVWINAEGRAKLLDFPAPGLNDSKRIAGASGPELFLFEVAAVALEGRRNRPAEDTITAAIPLHARQFLDDRKTLANPESAGRALKLLTQKTVQVTRIRRVVLVAGCLAIPFFMFFSAAIAVGIGLKVVKDQPAIQELSHLLFSRQSMKINRERNPGFVDDRLYAIYIAHHFRDIVRNSKLWSSYFPMAFIQRADREFVEQSIRDYSNPTVAEIAEAEAAVNSAVPRDKFKKDIERIEFLIADPFFYLAVAGAILLFYVAFPAIIAAFCFRGGLVLLVCGVGVVRKDGLPASRLRVFWRSLLTWVAPFIAASAGVILMNPVARPAGTTLLVVLLAAGMIVWSTLLPDRGIPDRLSGTRLVPR